MADEKYYEVVKIDRPSDTGRRHWTEIIHPVSALSSQWLVQGICTVHCWNPVHPRPSRYS